MHLFMKPGSDDGEDGGEEGEDKGGDGESGGGGGKDGGVCGDGGGSVNDIVNGGEMKTVVVKIVMPMEVLDGGGYGFDDEVGSDDDRVSVKALQSVIKSFFLLHSS